MKRGSTRAWPVLALVLAVVVLASGCQRRATPIDFDQGPNADISKSRGPAAPAASPVGGSQPAPRYRFVEATAPYPPHHGRIYIEAALQDGSLVGELEKDDDHLAEHPSFIWKNGVGHLLNLPPANKHGLVVTGANAKGDCCGYRMQTYMAMRTGSPTGAMGQVVLKHPFVVRSGKFSGLTWLKQGMEGVPTGIAQDGTVVGLLYGYQDAPARSLIRVASIGK